MTSMDAAQHLAVNQIKGTGLRRLPGAIVMTMVRQRRLCMGNGKMRSLALRQPAGVRQGVRQSAMLRKQQQRNQRAAQPLRAQGRTQQAGHVGKEVLHTADDLNRAPAIAQSGTLYTPRYTRNVP